MTAGRKTFPAGSRGVRVLAALALLAVVAFCLAPAGLGRAGSGAVQPGPPPAAAGLVAAAFWAATFFRPYARAAGCRTGGFRQLSCDMDDRGV